MCFNVIHQLVILTFVVKGIISQETEPSVESNEINKCSLMSNCNECSFDESCYWSNHQCSEIVIKSSFPWYARLSHCLLKGNQSDSKKYCGEVKEKQIPFIPLISREVIRSNVPNLFCKWTLDHFIASTDYKIQYKKGFYKNNQFAIVFNSLAGTEEHSLDEDFFVSKRGLHGITIYYYGYNLNKETIQDFVFRVEDGSQFSYLILVIVFLTLVLSALAGLLFSIFRIKYTKKTNAKIAQKKQEEQNKKMEEILKQMPYKSLNIFNITTCMICLESFDENAIVSQFRCKHVYHYECIKKWIEKDYQRSKCPNCKQSLFIKTNPSIEPLTVITFPTSIQTRLELSQLKQNQNNINCENHSAISLNVNNNEFNSISQRSLTMQNQNEIEM